MVNFSLFDGSKVCNFFILFLFIRFLLIFFELLPNFFGNEFDFHFIID